MKIRIFIYGIVAIGIQLLIGHILDQGQGGVGVVLFTVFVEVDPQMSFSFIQKDKKEK